jgi:hypothetical protein
MNAPIKPGAACAALAATLAFSLIFAPNTFAQEAEAEPVTVTGEPVTVTGSMIPTTEEVGSNPVSIPDRDFINKSGRGTTTEQLLKILPIASANSIPVQNNATAVGGPPGAASISLVVSIRALHWFSSMAAVSPRILGHPPGVPLSSI